MGPRSDSGARRRPVTQTGAVASSARPITALVRGLRSFGRVGNAAREVRKTRTLEQRLGRQIEKPARDGAALGGATLPERDLIWRSRRQARRETASPEAADRKSASIVRA